MTTSEVDRWWPADDPDRHGVAIVCGRISSLLVVDIDPRNGGEQSVERLRLGGKVLPPTLTVRSGGRDQGTHLYFRYDGDLRGSKLADGVDLKAGGGYVVAPPSRHPETNTEYRFVGPHELADAPSWLLDSQADQPPLPVDFEPDPPEQLEVSDLAEGHRNDGLTSVAGSMRAAGMSVQQMTEALRVENTRRCVPPLDDTDIRTIAKSIGRYPEGDAWAGPDPQWFSHVVRAIATDVLVHHSYSAMDGLYVIALASFGDGAYPSLNTIAEAWGGATSDTVGRHLKEVRNAGRLTATERRRSNGSRTSNEYRFILRDDERPPEDALPNPQNLPDGES